MEGDRNVCIGVGTRDTDLNGPYFQPCLWLWALDGNELYSAGTYTKRLSLQKDARDGTIVRVHIDMKEQTIGFQLGRTGNFVSKVFTDIPMDQPLYPAGYLTSGNMWNGFKLDALTGYTFFPQQVPGEEGSQQPGKNWKKIATDQQLASFDPTKSGFDFQVFKHGGGRDDESKGGSYLWMGKTFMEKSKPDFKC